MDCAVDCCRALARRAYISGHWADLSLIVVSPPLLVPPEAQALRVLRMFRLLRALAVVGIVGERLGRPLTRRALLVVLALPGFVLVAGGLLIVAVEPHTLSTVERGSAGA